MTTTDPPANTPYVGALMRTVWQWVWERNYAGVAAAGYTSGYLAVLTIVAIGTVLIASAESWLGARFRKTHRGWVALQLDGGDIR
jgi:hypothetical protein